ncbi:MAG: Tn3 family transposase [Chloroflexi bacterium]|nr:Tn3 family transposase [Chloroflexota bacterium]
MTNAVLAYNATILSNLLLHHLANQNTQQAALLSRVSPIAWQHINFYGHYEFTKPPELIDVDALVQELAQFDIELLET